MNRLVPAIALLACLCAGGALAHTPGTSTEPADGATLDAVPEALRLSFAGPMRVVKVVMVHDGPTGARETRLDVPSKAPTESLALSPEFAGPGDYRVEWRGLGEDGHVMTGEFSFSVR